MDFKYYTIAPKGRLKYGTYSSSGNINRKIIQINNGGNGTTSGGTIEVDTGSTPETSVTWNISLSQNTGEFDSDVLAETAQTISIFTIGYKERSRAQVFIGDISTTASTEDYGITGITSGLSVEVEHNGTTATTLNITAANNLNTRRGMLTIPCNIYIGRGFMDNEDDISEWNSDREQCVSVNLNFAWTVSSKQGKNGAAIRGPFLWGNDNNSRRFCNGIGETDEDKKWIDIIYRQDEITEEWSYWYCNTSYTGTLQDTWNNVKNNWTKSDNNFNFIATDLLLANNAKIKFLTNNEIYLMNSGGTEVTAGAAGGDGISFWAGDTDNGSHLENAPFRVYNDGEMIAENAQIKGNIEARNFNLTPSDFTPDIGDRNGFNFLYNIDGLEMPIAKFAMEEEDGKIQVNLYILRNPGTSEAKWMKISLSALEEVGNPTTPITFFTMPDSGYFNGVIDTTTGTERILFRDASGKYYTDTSKRTLVNGTYYLKSEHNAYCKFISTEGAYDDNKTLWIENNSYAKVIEVKIYYITNGIATIKYAYLMPYVSIISSGGSLKVSWNNNITCIATSQSTLASSSTYNIVRILNSGGTFNADTLNRHYPTEGNFIYMNITNYRNSNNLTIQELNDNAMNNQYIYYPLSSPILSLGIVLPPDDEENDGGEENIEL